ncbi:glycosyltransferase family 2 protein [Marinitoga aeolica]|uniref:Glycosyltransferase family 2 protein n=1 Tax=Marinitoga aeolica TaxID=2809031 RepID=A0ABY8PQY3_9BACT|nr:glycosyltransferase family 2 protein [Marinitoga aeolica]WGS65027.1 glycosyltransferase family 2 protein [Marinitoga aeolica]
MAPKIAALVVTYNRKDLLRETLKAILMQTFSINTLFVINNASTDGTDKVLEEYKEKYSDKIKIVNLEENLGGAGGFNYGIHYIYNTFKYDWIWLMDDDAVPAENALETLFTYYNNLPKKKQNKIGVLQNKRVLDRKWFDENNGKYFPLKAKKRWAGTFVGYLIKTEVVGKIGFPEKEFFIYSDDVEYTLRVRKMGYKTLTIFGSYIYHPTWTTQWDYIFKKRKIKIPGWKIYYVFRNPFLIYKNNEMIKFFLKIFFKFDALIWKRIDPKLYPFALKGLKDGLNGIGGKVIKPGQKDIKEVSK